MKFLICWVFPSSSPFFQDSSESKQDPVCLWSFGLQRPSVVFPLAACLLQELRHLPMESLVFGVLLATCHGLT